MLSKGRTWSPPSNDSHIPTHPVDATVVLLLCYPKRRLEYLPLGLGSFIEDVVLVLAEGETVESGRSGF